MSFSYTMPIRRSRMPEKRRHLIRSWNHENEKKLTDEQLVVRAQARARQPPLMIKDLFGVFGIYHNFFWRSILLNSVLWSLCAVHYQMIRILTLTNKDYETTDTEKTVYKPHRNFESFGLSSEYKNFIDSAQIFAQFIGPLYILLRHGVGRRQVMLECCLLYLASSCLSLISYDPVIRLCIVFTSVFVRTIRYVALLHLSESISPRLLPLALGIVGVSDCLFLSAFEIGITFMTTWKYIVILLGLLIGMTGPMYYVYVPPALLLDITLKDGNKVQNVITTTLHDSGIIDVDALIDDTIFTGKVMVSPWKRAIALLKVRHFRNKYLYLIVLQTAQGCIQGTASKSLAEKAAVGLTEAGLISVVVQGIASVVCIASIHRSGRRFTLMLHILTSLLGLVFLGAVRFEKFDVCIMNDISDGIGIGIAAVWSIILLYCSRVLKIAVRLVLLQHIPVEDHTTLFSAAMMSMAVPKIVLDLLADTEKLSTYVYPGRVYMIGLAVVALFTPTVVFMDNCGTMPLIDTDYKAYHIRRQPWNTSPRMADEVYHFPPEEEGEI